MTKTVKWALGSACAAWVLAGLGPLMTSLGWIPARVGFGLLLASLVPGLIAVVLGVAGSVRRACVVASRRWALLALVLALGHAATLALPAAESFDAPLINDLTTDPAVPPLFDPRGVAARAARAPIGPPVAETIAVQRENYPDLQPIELALLREDARARVKAVISELGWQSTFRTEDGLHFEATNTSPIFGFVDDVVIRLRPRETSTVIDIRSRSRVGKGDLGANAARIRRFTRALVSDD